VIEVWFITQGGQGGICQFFVKFLYFDHETQNLHETDKRPHEVRDFDPAQPGLPVYIQGYEHF
jgi:hypothetical protein